MRLILASTSPRRREILALLGLPFEIIAPQFEEQVTPQVSIRTEVLDFAVNKARSVAHQHTAAIVIGSDTMIELDGVKMGKPNDFQDAKRMLRALSARAHRIHTGLALIDGRGGPGFRIVEEVLVQMRHFSERGIDSYLACGESLDKAGAYSIQGWGAELIESIQGDFLAAVGMPLKPIADYLKSQGISFPLEIDQLYTAKSFLNWSRF
jgi:septum formation protein